MSKMNKNPDEMKFGQLMGNIGRLHSTRADQVTERIGLYRGQAILLMILSERNGLTHSEIAEKLKISPSAATKVIKRLESLHYLRRMPDPGDERISHVYLEEEGRAVIHQIIQAFDQIDQMLLGKLTPEEQATLIQLLKKVYASLLESAQDEE